MQVCERNRTGVQFRRRRIAFRGALGHF